MNKRIFFCTLSVLIILSMAFTPFRKPSQPPIFEDPFNYPTNGFLQNAYVAWKDGAEVSVSLEKDLRDPGNSAMRVDLQGPNPRTAGRDASIFRILQLLERRWSGAGAVRLWVDNSSDYPLILSFNFKEEFSEYWVTSGNQVFFLEADDGTLFKQNAQFGNLPIPAAYQGYVVIPFAGMVVPDWNTAHGDSRMDVNAVESFALGINVEQHYPRHFYVDDFSVLADSYPYLEISGPREIEIPSSGELREPYSASLFSPEGRLIESVEPEWTLAPGSDPGLRLEPGGWLVVPHGLASQKTTLVAIDSFRGRTLKVEQTIDLPGGAQDGLVEPQPDLEAPVVTNPALREKSAYEQFSENFEKWAFENRTLFVLLSVGVIVIVLVVLSYFQHRLH